MAISLYRKLHMSFWNDEYVLEHLTKPEEKLLYAYLITNSKSSVSGIYKITPFYVSMHTGILIEDVRVIFKKLIKDGKIRYNEETKEVFLLNALKYNKSAGAPPKDNRDGKGFNTKYLAQYKNDLLDVICIDFVKEWFQRAERFDFKVGFTLNDILNKQPPAEEEKEEKGGVQGPLFSPPGDDSSSGDDKPPEKGKEKKGKEKKAKKAKKVKEPFKIPDDIDPIVWKEFVKMRVKVGHSMTEYAMTRMFAKLQALHDETGHAKDDMLNQSIDHSWKGVFPLKEPPAQPASPPSAPPPSSALVDKEDDSDDPWKGMQTP